MANSDAPDLRRFLEQADTLLKGVAQSENNLDPQIMDYFITRLKIVDTALTRLMQTHDFTQDGNCSTQVRRNNYYHQM